MAKLHFYYSAMNAGKSTTLLQSSHNYNERGMDTLLYAPSVDDRYGVGKISTRIGLQANAVPIDDNVDIFADVRQRCMKNPNIACVLVDEAQFLNRKQVGELAQVADELDIPVLAYGIRSDYKAEPFPGSLYLLAWADVLTEIKTICHCGCKATMNLRVDSEGNAVREGNQVFIGGNESFVATCRKHFRLGQGHKKRKAVAASRLRKLSEDVRMRQQYLEKG